MASSSKAKAKIEDDKFSELLIEAVKPRTFLWDWTLPGYGKNEKQKEDLWSEIQGELEAADITKSVDEISRKWLYLKHEFGRRCKKKPPGSGANWMWFEPLSFLKEQRDKRRKRRRVDTDGDESAEEEEEEEEEQEEKHEQAATVLETIYAPQKSGQQSRAEPRPVPPVKNKAVVRSAETDESPSKKAKHTAEPSGDGFDSRLAKLALSLNMPPQKLSANASFGVYVSSVLDELSPGRSIKARQEISMLLVRVQSEDMQEDG